jgi:FMN phosphatase YigB (HAD superfamily)
MNFSEFALFFDDGGVMNDNKIRGIQFQKMIGDYFAPIYGGEKHQWAEANFSFIEEIMREYRYIIEEEREVDYQIYYNDFITRWIENMFEYVGVNLPAKNEYKRIFKEAMEFITPNVRASFPGVINSIRKLKKLGFQLYTASGEVSWELKGYLRGMGVLNCFEECYGPDLINTHKVNEKFYEKIFSRSYVEPKKSIIIEDNPKFIEFAQSLGSSVIQACVTGDHEPSYPFYVTDMNDLPEVVMKLVSKKM